MIKNGGTFESPFQITNSLRVKNSEDVNAKPEVENSIV